MILLVWNTSRSRLPASEQFVVSYCFHFHSMSISNGTPKEQAPSIEVNSLSYAFPDGSSGLQNVSLSLPPRSRTLLIGGILLFIKPGIISSSNR